MAARWGLGAKRTGAVVASLLGAAGCFSPSPEAVASLAAVQRDGALLQRQMENLEDRLLGNQAKVHFWAELSERHQNVSAIACESAASHLVSMERLQLNQKRKERDKVLAVRTAETSGVLARTGEQRLHWNED